MWHRVPILLKVALAWFPFFVVWVLFILTYAEAATLRDAVLSSIYTIVGAAILGVPVWWLTGRVAWPERVHVPFYILHLGVGSWYATAWLSIGYVAAAAGTEERFFDIIRQSDVLGWQFLTGLWLYGFVAGTSYAVRNRDRLREQESVAARAESLAATAQLKALRNQLNPHFLFNALHSLSVLIKDSPDVATRAVDRLGELLRYALDEPGDFVLLRDEWTFTKTYLELERLRFGDRLILKDEVDADALSCPVPAFCLQPLVENAVRHGIAPKPSGGSITVLASAANGQLRLVVRDDGAGSVSTPSSSGVGLQSLRQRLVSIYRGAAQMSVTTGTGEGFEVQLLLPAHVEDESQPIGAPHSAQPA